ncbi:2OG-Fe(II) oxygenase [Robiginitalea sp.]|nr:2OG-Fe(II) oxygenase [Robiginitalea sp.]
MNYICALFQHNMADQLFEQLAFEPNAMFEKIIEDLMDRQYSVVPNFMSQSDIERLREELLDAYEKDIFQKAAIGNKFNEQIVTEVRGDFILWLDQHSGRYAAKYFLERIDELVAYLNRTCFLGIVIREFHYAVYPKGSFYQRHLDAFQNDDRRRLSVILYLNAADWKAQDGGELVIYPNESKEHAEIKVHPWGGQLVIFESQLIEHEVLPARRERLSITGWLKTR